MDTLFLFSEQCPVLLRQALDRENKEKENNGSAHNGTSGKIRPKKKDEGSDSESEGEPLNYNSEASASSEEEEEPNSSLETKDAPASSESSSTNATAQTKPKNTVAKPAKPTQTQQQRNHAVKKHVENLVCDALPIHDTEAMHISTSLLSKYSSSGVDIADRNYVAQTPCREYLELSESLQTKNATNKNAVMIILLRSGRFAGGIFQGPNCLVHRACQRYTVRKGQGKAQSTQDANRKAKSMGAQLRRAGEENLQEDIAETMQDWKSHIRSKVVLILLSCPKSMKKYLFDAINMNTITKEGDIISKNDRRIRRLPLDMGRPTFDNVCVAHQTMMTVQLRHWSPEMIKVYNSDDDNQQSKVTKDKPKQAEATKEETIKEPETVFPLTPLHEACQKGDLEAMEELLEDLQKEITLPDETILTVEKMIHRRVGPDFMTCLHYAAAASSSPSALPQDSDTAAIQQQESVSLVDADKAAACVTKLLVDAKADPCIVDARLRPPYFLASHDKVRDAFRMARATLGEDYCAWEQKAKVGPPLTMDDVEAKKEREAEKKRKKKARQKQKKAQDKAQAEQEQRQREQAEESKKQEEEAKRIRDGLQPKAAAAGGTACDFCQKVVKGRKRRDMFSRLEYVYCSADCVNKHKRELMAAAAMARFGGS